MSSSRIIRMAFVIGVAIASLAVAQAQTRKPNVVILATGGTIAGAGAAGGYG